MSYRVLAVLSVVKLFLFSVLTAQQSQIEKCIQLAMAGKYEEAIRDLQRVLDLDPKHVEARRYLESSRLVLFEKFASQGKESVGRSKWDEATRAFRRAARCV